MARALELDVASLQEIFKLQEKVKHLEQRVAAQKEDATPNSGLLESSLSCHGDDLTADDLTDFEEVGYSDFEDWNDLEQRQHRAKRQLRS